jgi:hypothetical protein
MGDSFNKWYAEMLGKGEILSELLARFHVGAGDYQSGIEDPDEREREGMQNSLWLDDSDMAPTFHERAWIASADQYFSYPRTATWVLLKARSMKVMCLR